MSEIIVCLIAGLGVGGGMMMLNRATGVILVVLGIVILSVNFVSQV